MRPPFLLLALLLCTLPIAIGTAQTLSLPQLDRTLDRIDTTWGDDPELAIRQLDSLLPLSSKLDTPRLIRTLQLRGRANRLRGDYVVAIGEWKQVYDYATQKRDSLMLVEAADQIGIMNTYMGNLLEGQGYLLQVADIYDRIGSPADRAGAMNGLAILYSDLEQEEDAIRMYERSLVLYEEIQDTGGMAAVNANLGMMYMDRGDFERAEDHLRRQGRLDSLVEDKYGLAFYYDFLGSLRKKQGRYAEALTLTERGLALREELPSDYNIAESLNSVAAILLDLERYREAIDRAQRVLDFREDHNSLSQESNALEIMSEAHEKLGDPVAALSYYRDYKEISDSIYQRDRLSEIANKDALYQKVKREEEIAQLGQTNLLNRAEIQRKNRALLITGISLALITLFAGGFWYLFRKLAAQKEGLQTLHDQKDVLLREIHHRVKNNLQMVSSLLSLQSDFIEDEGALDAIQMGQRRVRSMAIIHQRLYMSEEISTNISAKSYLDQLIRELMGTLNVTGIPLTMHKNLEDIELDIDRLIPLGLVANEVITNAMKYAFTDRESGELHIDFRRLGPEVELRIADDGPGLNGKLLADSDSFGSLLIHTFAEQLEGEVVVDGSEGMVVRLRFPY